MRLSESERLAIREVVTRRLGPSAKAMLFGSRVDDMRRGGDIDLLIEVPHEVEEPLAESVHLEVDLMRALGERKIDVLLSYPGVADQPFHAMARKAAVPV
jgi:predicted nucleotidyltransferase